MMRIGFIFALLFLCISITVQAAPSRIELNDGSVLIGEIVSFSNGTYHVRTPYGEVTVAASLVKAITNASGNGPAAPQTQTAAAGQLPPEAGDLAIQGSNTIGAKLMPALLESFFGRYPNSSFEWVQGSTEEDRTLVVKTSAAPRPLQIQLGSHGSKTAFEALIANKADIGAASRPINDQEWQDASHAGLGDLRSPNTGEHVLALDGLVILVHPSNSSNTLDLDTIAKIFAGEISDWSQVPGNSAKGPINIYARDDKSGTFDTFVNLVMKSRKLVATAKRFESNEDLSDAVAADPRGIGFTGFAYVRNARALTLTTSCGQVFKPSIFSVKTEEYPLSRRLFLYTPVRKPRQIAAAFLEFAKSADAQQIVADNGFINLGIDPSTDTYASTRLADMMAEPGNDFALLKGLVSRIRTAHRLSVTFRFRSGLSDLDSRALPDLDRLIDYLKKQPGVQGKKVMLIGFSDTRGDFNTNVRLSRQRAETVAAALRQKNLTSVDVSGFGPLAPVACSDTDEGLAKNRRVEIWVE